MNQSGIGPQVDAGSQSRTYPVFILYYTHICCTAQSASSSNQKATNSPNPNSLPVCLSGTPPTVSSHPHSVPSQTRPSLGTLLSQWGMQAKLGTAIDAPHSTALPPSPRSSIPARSRPCLRRAHCHFIGCVCPMSGFLLSPFCVCGLFPHMVIYPEDGSRHGDTKVPLSQSVRN
ncbi:uncharacterized protein EURHEDRAFT_117901 [Aspergillus ruber CBS 135680]|uniref:Uncharacterized protein n=1 Tax=Aspergillus ruber (strain CBS 135680) TaxID=1388766 RepID=A0A017SPY8_ASPRC|nr:uncharacterized protein EURHEDRAFT_117901 [Aspergillus ruber CBS 135680]EYE98876.1 hypothetical protein EURHEDRAFT_117901 [Aspergillus ruber CBS 135680]